MIEFDLHRQTVRELNEALHAWPAQTTGGAADGRRVRVLNPEGRHALAAGLNAPIEVEIAGSVGYYCAG
ncbi:MAG: hypothetical protein MI723_08920, partial [Caulobacterales bacterium]|nr:hypothetical protein [Caulobacterales bacterium]